MLIYISKEYICRVALRGKPVVICQLFPLFNIPFGKYKYVLLTINRNYSWIAIWLHNTQKKILTFHNVTNISYKRAHTLENYYVYDSYYWWHLGYWSNVLYIYKLIYGDTLPAFLNNLSASISSLLSSFSTRSTI